MHNVWFVPDMEISRQCGNQACDALWLIEFTKQISLSN